MFYDKMGRTWNGRKIVWLRSANCSRLAYYRRVKKDSGWKLVYDKKRGMYDKKGNNVKETTVEIIPALEGVDDNGLVVNGTWEFFPDTKEAWSFCKSITPNGYVSQENDIGIDGFDDEFDEELLK